MNPSDLIFQYHESEALKTRFRLKVMDASYYIFDRNYQELMKLLMEVQEPEKAQKIWPQKRILHAILRELSRLLHNLVASAMSLVEHDRNIIIKGHYKGTKLSKRYQKEINKRFKNDPTAGFVQDLRNYTLHVKFPPLGANFRGEVDPETQRATFTHPITLNKATLLDWDGWTKRSKTYLDNVDDQIEIKEVIEEYAQAVQSFHQWKMDRLHEIHADELKWLEKTEREIRKVLANLPGPI
jgi:hypothetical protein